MNKDTREIERFFELMNNLKSYGEVFMSNDIDHSGSMHPCDTLLSPDDSMDYLAKRQEFFDIGLKYDLTLKEITGILLRPVLNNNSMPMR